MLLAIVAVASRGERVSPAGGDGPSDSLWDYVLSTYLVLGAITFAGLIYVLAKERESLRTKRSKHRDLRQLFQLALVLAAVFLVGRQFYEIFNRGDDRSQGAQTQPSRTGRSSRVGEPAARAEDRQFRWAPAIALGALGLVSVAVFATMRARRRNQVDDGTMADALAAVLEDALADLRAERDPRRAIIAAYARMERLLAVHGVPRDPAEAPFEYLGRVLVELHASAGSVFELTALFERAKFSLHEVDTAMKDEAIAALAAVRDELRSRT